MAKCLFVFVLWGGSWLSLFGFFGLVFGRGCLESGLHRLCTCFIDVMTPWPVFLIVLGSVPVI